MHAQEQFRVLTYGASKYPPICLWDKHVSFPPSRCRQTSRRPSKWPQAWYGRYDDLASAGYFLGQTHRWVIYKTQLLDSSVQHSGSTDPHVWAQEGGGGWSSRRLTEVDLSSCACVYEQDSTLYADRVNQQQECWHILSSKVWAKKKRVFIQGCQGDSWETPETRACQYCISQ